MTVSNLINNDKYTQTEKDSFIAFKKLNG